MPNCGPETSVTDWVIDSPAAMTVFQRLGIDYSCGGVSLEYACFKRGLHMNSVLNQIEMAEQEQQMRDSHGAEPE